jgi:peptide/nickel transport system substrate-binding protein
MCSSLLNRCRFLLVGALTVVFGALGCRAGDERGEADGSTLTVLLQADERLFAPYWSIGSQFLMFLPLNTFDERGEIVGRLAHSWEHSPDLRTWTFYLRSDVKWHDGVPVTAHDVKFTIELSAHPDVLFEDTWHDLVAITVPDDTTLTIEYSRPKDARNTWAVYYPKHHLEGLDPKKFWEWDFWTRPTGNGPYRYVRHVPKTMVELEANPDFYRGKPKIERLIFKFGGSMGIAELLGGNVDVLTWVNQADLPKLANDPRFEVYYSIWPDVSWLTVIFWNQEHPPFRDVRVRRALTLAIDRRELVRALNLPDDLMLTEVIFTPRQYWGGKLPAALPLDTARANRLLEQAGWVDNDADGVRDRNGDPLSFGAIVSSGNVRERAAIYVQAALKRIGVDMELHALENRIWRQRLRSGEYEAAFAPLYNAIDGHLQWFGPESPIGYDNPHVARLLASVKETADPNEIDRIYGELMPILRKELPVTILFPAVESYVAHRRLRGLQSPYRGDPIHFMEDLWIEEQRENP